MTFMEALATSMPMRRVSWVRHPPVSEKDGETLQYIAESTWIYPRVLIAKPGESAWISLLSGEPFALRRHDYLATDWEVLR